MRKGRRAFLAAAGGGLTALSSEAFARLAALPKTSPEASAQNEDFWFRVRESFTIDRNSINLNSGSVSPAPRSVQTAMHQYWDITNMSPSYYVDEILGPRIEVVRRRLAETFGCDPEEIALTRNTSEGMQIVQMGLDLKRGDEVLTTTQDYPRMLTAWNQREARDGIVLKTVSFPTPPEGPEDLLERIEGAITPRTRVILICHVTYTTGQIFPVKEICALARERGIETIVDGAHGFAHFPFTRDDLDCDYYATSLHKWLYAPVGTGFLYVRREKIRDVWPLMAAPVSMREDVRKFEEIGTHPLATRCAITEALAFHDGIGAERKAERLRFLRRRWSDRARSCPGVRVLNSDEPRASCGIGALGIEGIDANALTEHLEKKYRIHVRPRFVAGELDCIRVTPNVFTTLEEVDLFSEAIETISRKGLA
jgi:selenocysteine lyase/cysteine desulfurase